MASLKHEAAAIVTLATSALDSLANDARVLCTEYDNSNASNLYFMADFELVVDPASAPTDNNPVNLYLVPSLDGTNYIEGDASIVPRATLFVGSFPIRSSTDAQRHAIRGIPLSPVKFKALLENKTGQAFAASGNTLKMVPYRVQSA